MKVKELKLKKVAKIKYYRSPKRILRRLLKQKIYADLVSGKNIDQYMQSYNSFEVVMELVGDFNKIQEFIDTAES